MHDAHGKASIRIFSVFLRRPGMTETAGFKPARPVQDGSRAKARRREGKLAGKDTRQGPEGGLWIFHHREHRVHRGGFPGMKSKTSSGVSRPGRMTGRGQAKRDTALPQGDKHSAAPPDPILTAAATSMAGLSRVVRG